MADFERGYLAIMVERIRGETQCHGGIDRWSARVPLMPSRFTPCCRLSIDIIAYASTVIDETFH